MSAPRNTVPGGTVWRPANARPTNPRTANSRGIRITRFIVAALAAPALLTACSTAAELPAPPPGIDAASFDGASGNGLWLAPPSEIASIIVQSVHDAGPVSMQGTVHEFVFTEEGETLPARMLTIDYAGRPSGYRATFLAGGLEAQLLVDGGSTRVRGNAAYAASNGRPELTSVQCTVGTDPAAAQWAPFTEPATVLDAVLSGAQLSVAAPEDDDDSLAVQIGSSEAMVGVLTVERYGPPLPRSLSIAELEGDTELAFTAWGEPADLDAAAAALPCS